MASRCGHLACLLISMLHVASGWEWLNTGLCKAVCDADDSWTGWWFLLRVGADPNFRCHAFRTPLHCAAEAGHTDVVEYLLSYGAKIDKKNKYGKTPLHLATEEGHPAVVKVLLSHGANIEERNKGDTPLHWAVEAGHADVLEELLSGHGAKIQEKNKYGKTPLHLAAEEGHTDEVMVLLSHGAKTETKDEHGETPLHWAAEEGHAAAVEVLLSHGAKSEERNNWEKTPLHLAAQEGHTAAAKVLLSDGAKTEKKDKHGETPLHCAAEEGHKAVVELLLSRGAKIEQKSKTRKTPLHVAAEAGHTAAVKVLLSHGAKTEKKDEHGETPLHRAAEEGHASAVEILLSDGAKSEAKNELGETPLHLAVEENHTRAAEAILSSGASLTEKKTKYGKTPLHFAAEEGHTAAVELLLSHGAKTEKKDNYSETPLRCAAEKGHAAAVEALLEHRADPEATDPAGRTALHLAAERGDMAVVKALVEGNADALATDAQMETPLSIAARSHGNEQVAEWLGTHGGAEPSPLHIGSWVHVLRSHSRSVGACVCFGALVGLSTAAFGTAGLDWARSRRAGVATPSEGAPSKGALRMAAKAIASNGSPCGSLDYPMRLLAWGVTVVSSLLFVFGPCMWLANPLYLALLVGATLLASLPWTPDWGELVRLPALLLAAPVGTCRAALTTLLLLCACVLLITLPDHFHALHNEKLFGCFSFCGAQCHLARHRATFSLASLEWQSGWKNMQEMHEVLFKGLLLFAVAFVCGASSYACCCIRPVVSRVAVERLAREIDNAKAPDKLPQQLQPEGVVMKTCFALLDVVMDLNTIATFLVTNNFWFAGVLWAVFLHSLASELIRGNIQALPQELRRTLATGVMTDRIIDFLDTDKGFEAPFSLAVTVYAMPFAARGGTTFLTQCFSLLSSTYALATFLCDHMAVATLADDPPEDVAVLV